MVYYLIMCRSVTYAQKIVRTLERAGISAFMIRSPAEISPSGCSHSVKISKQNLPRALALLRQFRLPYTGIYVGSPEEGYQEVER